MDTESTVMNYTAIRYSCEEKVVTVALDRPQKLNSLNVQARDEIRLVLRECRENRSVRVVIFTGSGRVFCAGADIHELGAIRSAREIYEHSRDFQGLFEEVARFPRPTIAAVDGYALGAGCELALACDLCIASEDARFGLPEVALGAIPAAGGTQRLPRAIGTARAKEMLFTGEPIGAQEAWRLGLVNKVVPADALQEARALARRLCEKPPLALETLKSAVDTGLNLDITSALELEARSFATLFSSHDFKEGTAAFVEKRVPVFKGE